MIGKLTCVVILSRGVMLSVAKHLYHSERDPSVAALRATPSG